MSITAILCFIVLPIVLIGGLIAFTFILPTFHDFTCLCNACKKEYIKEKTKALEDNEKRLEWYRWRKIVDEHFSDIEKKRFQ